MFEHSKADCVEVLYVRTCFKLHQREYIRDQSISVSEVGQDAWRWLFDGLDRLAARSQENPVSLSLWSNLQRGLGYAKDIPEWKHLVSLPPAKVSVEDVVRFFSEFELALFANDSLTPGVQRRISWDVRRFVTEVTKASSSDRRFKLVRSLYRSILTDFGGHRALISDIPALDSPPIGALKHSSNFELKESISTALHADLDSIKKVCITILDSYDAAIAEVASLDAVELDPTREADIRRRVRAADLRSWSKQDIDLYLALRVQEVSGKVAALNYLDSRGRREPTGAKARLRERLGGLSNGPSISALIEIALAPPTLVLLACALILQIHTHWNFISVLEMAYEKLKVGVFPHRLQSVKPRTSDATPVVFVERCDVLVLRAMKSLTDRRERLVKAGRIGAEVKSVWISGEAVRGGGDWPVVSWGGVLRRMTERYQLKPFTLEQVRCQCLAVISIGSRGLSGVVQSAGHSSDRTSLRYIDQVLLRRLNSAHLLEFEKRLEQAIYYSAKEISEGKQYEYLIPIGDGASCAAPNDPPQSDWLDAGICRAEHCHQGTGCVHRRLEIDEARVEEVVRLKRYYVENWEQLATQNMVSFERIHAPQILFNFALYGVLRRGPYRHLVKRYEDN
ncbi:MAG: hypothetical protein EON54_13510 [Alcaligenaceae bacterium]|nr:MAG: hypothetical protein EON54_13510 [Alcaligenaceae bacterium]